MDTFMHLPLFTEVVFARIQAAVGKPLKLGRVMAVAQTFGQDSSFHVDHKAFTKVTHPPDGQDFESKEVTFCLYVNLEEDGVEDGCIYFKVPKEKHLVAIEPLHNRGLYFPAYLLHKPTAFFSSKLRVCVTWKMTLSE
jgi:hypothetical protein